MSNDTPELTAENQQIQSVISDVEVESTAVVEDSQQLNKQGIERHISNDVTDTAQLSELSPQENDSVESSSGETSSRNTPEIDNHKTADVVQLQRTGFVYGLGSLEVVFPNRGIKKEFLQAAMSLSVKEDDYYAVFTNNQSRNHPDKYLYLAEQVEWVLTIDLKRTYLIRPVTEGVLQLLIDAIQSPTDTLEPKYTCIIGAVMSADHTSDLTEVATQQVYSHTLAELHESIQNNSSAETQVIQNVIDELEYRPNKGESDFDRARNYIAYRYPDVYQHSNTMHSGSGDFSSASLVRIDFARFDGASQRKIVDVSLVYQENNSVSRIYYFCRVDVTGMYPFMVSELQRFTPLQTYNASRV